MAKLKAPLLSLGASGQLGKTVVHFPWKGLNVVREYVVPSNPRTSAQQTQRGFLIDAVEAIHAAQALALRPLGDKDQSAYSLWGSLFPGPRTWFNQIIKMWLDQNRADKKAVIYRDATVTPGVTKLTVSMAYTVQGLNDITAGHLWYGTSKSNLIKSIACTGADLTTGKDITGLTPGTKYYVQYRPTAHADFVGAYSGIVYGVPVAA